MRQKWPDKVHMNQGVLHHDNAPAHIALAVQQFLASKYMTVIPHPLNHQFEPPVTSSSPKDENQVEGAKMLTQRTSRTASNRGRNIVIVSYAPKVSTLKGMVAIRTLNVLPFLLICFVNFCSTSWISV
jgi:hypothetical protein